MGATIQKLVIDKKGKVKIRKPLILYVFTDILVIVKLLKTMVDHDSISDDTDLLMFPSKNYKSRGTLELKDVIKRSQISNLSVAHRKLMP